MTSHEGRLLSMHLESCIEMRRVWPASPTSRRRSADGERRAARASDQSTCREGCW